LLTQAAFQTYAVVAAELDGTADLAREGVYAELVGKPWLYRFDGDPDNCRLIEFHWNR